MTGSGLILAVESSCDETSVAVVRPRDARCGGAGVGGRRAARRILATIVASQVALHSATGGIVPEVAARAHLRWILPVLDEAWRDAGASWDDVGAVAVTRGPGLAGSLLVGINVA